jgi:hypothetical protein
MAILVGLLGLLSLGVVAACQVPAGSGSSPTPVAPDRSTAPVAPAIETDHPDAESPIPLPSAQGPAAPAIEMEHPDAENRIPSPTDAP